MPVAGLALVQGILVSVAVVAAVGIILQRPEVQEWIEEQRCALVELLETWSGGLDPRTRREAEGFAFEGRMPTRREVQGMSDAAAVATGRENGTAPAAQRVHRQSSATTEEMTERRRLGREYLARRNQELLSRRNQTNTEGAADVATDTSSTSSTGSTFPASRHISTNTRDERNSALDAENKQTHERPELVSIPAYQSAEPNISAPVAMRAFHAGSSFGNPFGDEFATEDDRSVTPRPAVPPKIAIAELPNSDPPLSVPDEGQYDIGLTTIGTQSQDSLYDEQLARALSLSLADNEESELRILQRTQTEEEAYMSAIQESLETHYQPVHGNAQSGPLVDFSSLPSPPQHDPRSHGRHLSDDELYSITPQVTGVAIFPTVGDTSREDGDQMIQSVVALSPQTGGGLQGHVLASVAQSPASVPRDAISTTISPILAPVETTSDQSFETDSETDDFTSLRGSVVAGDFSLVEVEDIDIASMSDDEDGVHTPRSWSEIGSEVDESERSESDSGDVVHL